MSGPTSPTIVNSLAVDSAPTSIFSPISPVLRTERGIVHHHLARPRREPAAFELEPPQAARASRRTPRTAASPGWSGPTISIGPITCPSVASNSGHRPDLGREATKERRPRYPNPAGGISATANPVSVVGVLLADGLADRGGKHERARQERDADDDRGDRQS